METKSLHFQAAAQYRKSLEDLEAHRYMQSTRKLCHTDRSMLSDMGMRFRDSRKLRLWRRRVMT